MRHTARAALAKRLEMLRAGFSSDEDAALRTRLQAIGKDGVEVYLRCSSGIGLHLAEAASQREFRSKLAELHGVDELLTRYTATAWAARALVFAELLHQLELEPPERWAAQSTLAWLKDFEEQEVWLWPFDSPSPWPDEDDDDFD